MTRFIEQHFDSPGEVRAFFRSSCRYDRRAHATGDFDDPGEAGGVGTRLSGLFHYKIVAGDFTLQVDLTRDPSDYRMKRKYRFDGALDEECDIVAPEKVRGFVYANLFQFMIV